MHAVATGATSKINIKYPISGDLEDNLD